MKAGPFEIYFDFDNTVTSFDVLDEIIKKFSLNDRWIQWEEQWEKGTIGSRVCLERQLAEVRFTETDLDSYLASVPIDPAFTGILTLLNEHRIQPVIVSDSFVLIIEKILANHHITGIHILANEMVINDSRPIVSFPYANSICSTCGNCKTSHLFKRNRPEGTQKIYVGDGRSDICPANFCEVLFAKGSLYQHYHKSRPDCIPFSDLNTVHRNLLNLLS